jgi:FkbM family methyltransferase
MVVQLLKRIAARLPQSLQHELRRTYFRRQIRRDRFFTDEQEYGLLGTFIRPGDWVIDIGANVGHYTKRMSELVGATGRVIGIEPVPDTFALLAANAQLFANANVSLLNIAASDRPAVVAMQIPQFSEGLQNYYQARLTPDGVGPPILTLPIDSLALPATIRLVKIDVEGHELPVLRGMRTLLERDRPVLIVETSASETLRYLDELRYFVDRLPGSSNVICRTCPPVEL